MAPVSSSCMGRRSPLTAISSSPRHSLMPTRFTCRTVEGAARAGRTGVGYGVATEVEDLDAILTKTGAQDVFGVSVGAIVALHAARTLASIHKLAVFEPPFILNGSPSTAFLARYHSGDCRGERPCRLGHRHEGLGNGPRVLSRDAALVNGAAHEAHDRAGGPQREGR